MSIFKTLSCVLPSLSNVDTGKLMHSNINSYIETIIQIYSHRLSTNNDLAFLNNIDGTFHLPSRFCT